MNEQRFGREANREAGRDRLLEARTRRLEFSMASDWAIDAIAALPGATNVQQALEALATSMGGAPAAADVSFAPAGSITATNVQAALAELDGDIAGKADAAHVHTIANVTGLQAALEELDASRPPAIWEWGFALLDGPLSVSGTTTAALGSGSVNNALRNANRGNFFWWNSGQSLRSLTIDFGSARVISGILAYQDIAASSGSWQVQWSDDGSTWTDIGSPETWGANSVTVWNFSNSIPHRYWRLDQRSGSTTNAAWQQGFMFKWGATA